MGTSPSTKETTLHHFRDPLTRQLAADAEIDFPGVILQATSDVYLHKRFVARRTAALVGGLGADGALVCIDAWGNAHIDFASVIEFLGEQGIPVVGLSFVGVQAAFVVTNPYMDSIIDLNKSVEGVEMGVLGDNTAVELDAVKALAILKTKIRKKNPGRVSSPGPERAGRSLQQRIFPLKDMLPAKVTSLAGGVLRLDLEAIRGQVKARMKKAEGAEGDLFRRVKDFRLSIIRPGEHEVAVNSILDCSPIAAKVEGLLGEGATNILQGAQVLLSATDIQGLQPFNAGSASGRLGRVVRFGRPGTPGLEDFIFHVDVTLQRGEAVTREGVMGAHLVCDEAVQHIRACLAEQNRYQAVQRIRLLEVARPGLPRIALVKMTSGVSAMGDTAVFPDEPGGFRGSSSVMDLMHNLPVLLTPNEYRDGIVHSLS